MTILVFLITVGSNYPARDAMFRKCLPLRVITNYLTSGLGTNVITLKDS